MVSKLSQTCVTSELPHHIQLPFTRHEVMGKNKCRQEQFGVTFINRTYPKF